MQTVFVSGGAGFIGSNLVELFDKGDKYKIIVFDNLKSGFEKNLTGFKNIEFIKEDVRNFSMVNRYMKACKFVFHFAAEISVPQSMKTPEETEEINTLGTLNILKAMVNNGVKNIVFASSAAIYGESEVCPKTVDMLPAPISPYAISKLSGEYYIKMFAKEHGIDGVVTRFFNVFGEKQNPKSQYAAAIPIFISKAIKNEDITIYGDGEQTRDFIYVKDLVNYIYNLSLSGSGIYNLGYGQKITINELVRLIIKLTDSKSNVIYSEKRLGDVKHSFADVTPLKKRGGIKLIGFEEGLKNTIEYFKSL